MQDYIHQIIVGLRGDINIWSHLTQKFDNKFVDFFIYGYLIHFYLM